MSYNQQALISAPDDEVRVVDSFMEASRELNPTVQVTLAKRIIRPGSNKVLCLAARTSVPLNEDEMASVSDLALRLSDGTNVKLSLSFFNDEYGVAPISEQPALKAIAAPSAPYISMSRSFFDPNRYTPYQSRNESKLGMAIFTVILGITTGLYFVTESPLALIHPHKLKAAQSAPSASRTKIASMSAFPFPKLGGALSSRSAKVDKPGAAKSRIKNPSPEQVVRDAPKLGDLVTANAAVTKAAVTKRSLFLKKRPSASTRQSPHQIESAIEPSYVEPVRATRSARIPKNMFVPPPPPMVYTIDPSMYPPYLQWQNPNPPSAPKIEKVVKRAAPVQNPLADLPPAQAVTKNLPVSNVSNTGFSAIPNPSSVHANNSTTAGNSGKTVNANGTKLSPNAAGSESISTPLASPSKAPQVSVQPSKPDDASHRAAAQTVSNSIASGEIIRAHAKPLPGADQVQMERIRIPGQ